MKKISLEKVVKIFDEFINSNGLFYNFKEFIEAQGYTLEELGMKDEIILK